MMMDRCQRWTGGGEGQSPSWMARHQPVKALNKIGGRMRAQRMLLWVVRSSTSEVRQVRVVRGRESVRRRVLVVCQWSQVSRRAAIPTEEVVQLLLLEEMGMMVRRNDGRPVRRWMRWRWKGRSYLRLGRRQGPELHELRRPVMVQYSSSSSSTSVCKRTVVVAVAVNTVPRLLEQMMVQSRRGCCRGSRRVLLLLRKNTV